MKPIEILLTVILTINGTQYLGDQLDGWGSRAQPDWQTCMNRAGKGAQSTKPDGVTRWQWCCHSKILRRMQCVVSE